VVAAEHILLHESAAALQCSRDGRDQPADLRITNKG
jgi:hypothetical protein